LKYFGIDGCKAGWFYVWLDDRQSYGFGILETIDALTGLVDCTGTVLIDMPIGLKETGPQERRCDKAARQLLKNRASSIFPAPCRQSLRADDYLSASDTNFTVTGRRLSKQTYFIMPKIRELDHFMGAEGKQLDIHEFHPELGFLALNRFAPLKFSKKTGAGQQKRQHILSRYIPSAGAIIALAKNRFLRRQAGMDDILDAFCGAVTAAFRDHLIFLPAVPDIDPRGLDMQIVYADPDSPCPLSN